MNFMVIDGQMGWLRWLTFDDCGMKVKLQRSLLAYLYVIHYRWSYSFICGTKSILCGSACCGSVSNGRATAAKTEQSVSEIGLFCHETHR
jgi:hypothetical protein